MGIAVNPRRRVRVAAQGDLGEAVCKILKTHRLTNAEIWLILSEESRTWARYALKDEQQAAKPQLESGKA